jgi:diguanylate cyclase (GGDEF)-like protein/PAS domain S-box-containing protein
MTDISCLRASNAEAIDGVVWHEAPLVLLRIDAADRIVSGNPYAQQLTGLDFAGMTLDQVFLDFSPQPVPLNVRAMAAAKSPARLMLHTLEEQPASLLFRFIATSATEVLAIGWHDMPEVTNLQRQLIDLNNELNYVTRAALKDSQFEIERQTAKHRRILESAGEGIFSLDAEGRPLFVNPAAAATLGYRPEELIGAPGYALWHGCNPDGKPYAEADSPIQQTLAHGTSHATDEDYFQRKDGGFIPVAFTSSPIIDHRKVVGAVVTFSDITERKRTEIDLRLSASVFANSYEGIFVTDKENLIVDVNPSFCRITGFARDEVLGRNPSLLGSGRHGPEFFARMWESLREHNFWQGEVWNRRKGGDVYAEILSISVVRDSTGRLQHYIGVFSDITQLKTHEAELTRIAHYDTLTGIPNRRLLTDRLEQALARSRRGGKPMAVCYLDLDGFKSINDQHGHQVGDQLLIALAVRMKESLREGDTLARVGGDEFVAVLIELANVDDSVPMLTRLLAAAAQPVTVGELSLKVSASVGVSFNFPMAGQEADQLLRQADQAMYEAKLAGKNRYKVFDAEQDKNMRGHHDSLERIRQGLVAREFVLHYQPKVNMRTGKVIGAEALIRWQHPQRGLLPPAAFLPVIETHPLAVEVGEWVIDTALTQIELWRAAGLALPVSINVGASQLQSPNFVEGLRAMLAAHPGAPPDNLELEILETSALEDLAGVSKIMESCLAIGVKFALDDFGTGYSSLTYLRRLPAALIKIDQSFVRDMMDDPADLGILEGVLGLARTFRRQVIAEGVETVEHGALLLQLGCEQVQGYGIARPMPAHEVPEWLAAWRPAPAWADQHPIHRDDFPLLFAGIEHRAWIATVENHLRGGSEAPPPTDYSHCRFGEWLAGEGYARYGTQPAFEVIEPLHREIHELATELSDVHARGRTQESLTRLAELLGMSDALLGQLPALAQKCSQLAGKKPRIEHHGHNCAPNCAPTRPDD